MDRRYRALIVDDNLPIQRLSALALRQIGFDCQCSGDGLHASRLAQQTQFDVVVTELKIPNKHGHALTLELLELEPRPLIIIHTGFKEPRLVKDLLLRGVDDIIFKPIDFALLATKVYAFVQRRNLGSMNGRNAEPQQSAIENLGRVSLAQLNARLAEVTQLLPLSRSALQVYEMTTSLDRQVSEITSAIEQDASITTEVLRLANSTFYNPTGRPTRDLEQAVARIGQKRIGEIALTAHTLSVLTPHCLPWMDLDLAWKRSLAAGMLVESLVELGGHSEIDHGLSLSAIMHPLGRMVLGMLFPMHYEAMLGECQRNGESLEEQERRVFPVSHTEIAGNLLASWRIPLDVLMPLTFSLNDFSALARLAEPLRTKAELVKVAILLGRLVIGRWEDWDLVQLPPVSVLRRLGIKQAYVPLHQTRLDLEKIETSEYAGIPTAPAMEKESSCDIVYCNLSGAKPDLLFELLPAIGVRPQTRDVDDLQPLETPLIVNCIGRRPAQSAMKARPESTVVLTDSDRADLFRRYPEHVILPSSFSSLRESVLSAIDRIQYRSAAAP